MKKAKVVQPSKLCSNDNETWNMYEFKVDGEYKYIGGSSVDYAKNRLIHEQKVSNESVIEYTRILC